MRKFADITSVVDNNLCYSCAACIPVCQPDSIKFKFTKAGRLHPVVDYNTCTHCGVCNTVCPGLDPKNRVFGDIVEDPFEGKVVKSYLGKTLDNKIYNNSQSGGLVTEVLKYLFDKKLISHALVVKTEYSMNARPKAFLASNYGDIFSSQKSKYTPVDLLSPLKYINEIEGNICVVGLPCQIEGVISLIKQNRRKYEKIKYKLGLICNGVLSDVANDYFSQGINEEHKIIYRNKHVPNYLHSNVTVEFPNKKQKEISSRKRFILKELITPPRCQICFNKMAIHADLVFGDPWGIDGYDKERGEGIVISRNGLGEELLRNIKAESRIELKEIGYDEILTGQGIERKKMLVSDSLATYKDMNLIIPDYFSNVDGFNDLNRNTKINPKILRFLKFESMKKWNILLILNFTIIIVRLVEKMKGLIHKIKNLLVNHQ